MHEFHPTGMYLRDTWIQSIFDPPDADTYRRLIPEPFTMPDRPRVWAYFARFSEVGPWPLTPYREAALQIAVRLGSTVGWHTVMMPLTSRAGMWGGRLLGGFPKELAAVSLARTADDVVGVARKDGAVLLQMRLTHAMPAEPGSVELASAYRGVPIFNFVPPKRGSKIVATTFDVVDTPLVTGERGVVEFEADGSVPWASLLPDHSPGACFERTGTVILRFGRVASHVLAEREPVLA